MFVTTIVQVMFPWPSSWFAGEPVFVIARSTRKAQLSDADAGSGLPPFLVVSVAVLS